MTADIIRYNRDVFWQEIRKRNALKGKIRQSTVQGVNAFLEAWVWAFEKGYVPEDIASSYRKQASALSLILANVRIEVGINLKPVREGFAKTDAEARKHVLKLARTIGIKYAKPSANGEWHYGRGFIQETWPDNYKNSGSLIGYNLYDNPDKLLDPRISSRVSTANLLLGNYRRDRRTKKKQSLSLYAHEYGPEGFMGREMVNGDKNKTRDGVKIGDLCDDIADRIFACFVEAMKHPTDEWDVGDPIIWDKDGNTEPQKKEHTMSFSFGRLLPLLMGGFGGLSSCSNVGQQTGTIAPDSALTQIAAGGPESMLMIGIGLIMAMLMNQGSNTNLGDILKTLFAMQATPVNKETDDNIGRD